LALKPPPLLCDFVYADVVLAALGKQVAPEIHDGAGEHAGLAHAAVDQRGAGLELVRGHAAEIVGVADGPAVPDADELGIALIAGVDAGHLFLALAALPGTEARISA